MSHIKCTVETNMSVTRTIENATRHDCCDHKSQVLQTRHLADLWRDSTAELFEIVQPAAGGECVRCIRQRAAHTRSSADIAETNHDHRNVKTHKGYDNDKQVNK